MPRLTVAAKEQRRRRLLDAAWRCVAEGGYRNLSVDAVCAEAGLSKGAFYTYFGHKQDLLVGLLDDDAEGMSDVMGDAEAQASGAEQIRRFVAGLIERGADPATAHLRADLWAEISSDDALRGRFLDATRDRRARLAAMITDAISNDELVDVPANALAAVFLALGDGLMLHRVLDPSGFRWPNIAKAIDAILSGLGPDGPA